MNTDGHGSAIALNSSNQAILAGTVVEAETSDALVYRMSNTTPPQILDNYRIGGSSWEVGAGLATGPSGAVYLSGMTISTDYPTTPGVVQRFALGYGDAYLTKLTVA